MTFSPAMRDDAMRTALAGMRTGLHPLSAKDIAASVAFTVAVPAHVSIAGVVVVAVQHG